MVTWDPRLPSLQAIVQKHWRTMASVDPYLQEVYQEPPLVAEKYQGLSDQYQKNEKEPYKRNTRNEEMQQTLSGCPYIKEQKQIPTQFLYTLLNVIKKTPK